MQIVAMGGGGFSMEPENPLLDLYIISLARSQPAKVCFVPTASGDVQSYLQKFYSAFSMLECLPSHLSLFDPPTTDLRSFVMEKDIIYVGGGNTRNLLVLWREWGLDKIFYDAGQAGIVLSGISAGSICWFEEGVTDSFSKSDLRPLHCLGFLSGSNCPHYDGEPLRRPTYQELIRQGKLKSGYGVDDSAALHFVDGELVKVVSSRQKATAYLVQRAVDGIRERSLKAEFLGDEPQSGSRDPR
jgi:peptidase E